MIYLQSEKSMAAPQSPHPSRSIKRSCKATAHQAYTAMIGQETGLDASTIELERARHQNAAANVPVRVKRMN
jgi:hypothetical protein